MPCVCMIANMVSHPLNNTNRDCLGVLGCIAIFMMIGKVCWHLRLIAIIAACSMRKVAMDRDFSPDS